MNTAALFRKKPVVISAVRYVPDEQALCQAQAQALHHALEFDGVGYLLPVVATPEGFALKISTLEGEMLAQPGDWIIQGVAGELYPCKDTIFQATYEQV